MTAFWVLTLCRIISLFNILQECTASIFRVADLVQVDDDMWKQKMCWQHWKAGTLWPIRATYNFIILHGVWTQKTITSATLSVKTWKLIQASLLAPHLIAAVKEEERFTKNQYQLVALYYVFVGYFSPMFQPDFIGHLQAETSQKTNQQINNTVHKFGNDSWWI